MRRLAGLGTGEAVSVRPVLRWVAPVIAGVTAGAAAVGLSTTAGMLISRAGLRPEVFLSLGLLATAVRGFGIARAAARYAERLSGHIAALMLSVDLRLRLFDQVVAHRDGGPRTDQLLTYAHRDIDAAVMHLLRVTIPALTVGLVATGFTLWVGLQDVALVAWVGVPLAGFGALVAGAGLATATAADDEVELTARHASLLVNSMAASGDGAEPLLKAALDRSAMDLTAVQRLLARRDVRLAAAREVLLGVGLVGLFLTAGPLVRSGELAGARFVGLVLGMLAMFDLMGILSGVPDAIRQRSASLRRSRELAAAVTGGVAVAAVPVGSSPAPGRIRLSGVGVVRGGRQILRGVDLDILPGETVVIRGPSGVGKSTLLQVISGSLPPSGGVVSYGATVLDGSIDLGLSRIAAVHLQSAPLLDATVEENLRLGAGALDSAELRRALDAVGFPYPLSHPVGERGDRLSGGERARVSLIRALLSRAPVLLLDEPTGHLDTATEDAVLNVISHYRGNRTLLLVTHRPAPQRLGDRVLTLGPYGVVESGTGPGVHGAGRS